MMIYLIIMSKLQISEFSLLPRNVFKDERGTFQKIYGSKLGEDDLTLPPIIEIYSTNSKKNVLRGLHFQALPQTVGKLIWVTNGEIIDVVVDIRPGKKFGTVTTTTVNEASNFALWVPFGYAHGFQSATDNTVVNYATTAEYSNLFDDGILYNSINYEWPLPISYISNRDIKFQTLNEYHQKI